MSKRIWIKILTFICLALLGFEGFCQQPTNVKVNRPNIIIIYTDDQRQDALGSYENEIIITPNLDRIIAKGIRFTNANVVFSLCSPSRAALLTGRYGSANGVLQLGSGLKAGEKTVAQFLKDKGYQTGMTGKWHLKQPPQDLGFDFFAYFKSNGTYYGRKVMDMGTQKEVSEHCDVYCTNRSVDFLKEVTQKEKPFFLFHCTQLPHMNGKLVWDAKEETKALYQSSGMPIAPNRLDDLSEKPAYLQTVRNRTKAKDYGYPEKQAIQNHTRDYYSVITEMDQALDSLFRSMEALDLWDNTYLFFMSDNGWMLGDHGFTSKVLPYQPSTQVPLVIIGPGIEPQLNNHLVLNIDLMPTILELAGVKNPGNVHGESLVPLLNYASKTWRSGFIYEGLGTYGGAQPNLTFINQNYRYILTYKDASLQEIQFQELYDQQNDPGEMKNLASKPEFQDLIKGFQLEIENHKRYVLIH